MFFSRLFITVDALWIDHLMALLKRRKVSSKRIFSWTKIYLNHFTSKTIFLCVGCNITGYCPMSSLSFHPADELNIWTGNFPKPLSYTFTVCAFCCLPRLSEPNKMSNNWWQVCPHGPLNRHQEIVTHSLMACKTNMRSFSVVSDLISQPRVILGRIVGSALIRSRVCIMASTLWIPYCSRTAPHFRSCTWAKCNKAGLLCIT